MIIIRLKKCRNKKERSAWEELIDGFVQLEKATNFHPLHCYMEKKMKEDII